MCTLWVCVVKMTAKNNTNTGPDSEPDVTDEYDVEVTDDEIIVTPKGPDVNFPCDCSVAKGQKFTFEILHVLDVAETGYAFADMTCENCGSMQVVRIKVISQSIIPQLADLLGAIYRRKSDCGLCGLPVWAHVYTNGDYYMSCGCGETSKRKKADFNKENFVNAESGAHL